MSDLPALAAQALEGDRDAEAAVVAALRPGLVTLLRYGRFGRYIDVEDLVQDTLRVVIEALRGRTLHDPEKIVAYAAQTARMLTLNVLRKSFRQKTVVDSDLVEERAQEEGIETSEPDDEHLARAVVSLLAELPHERDRIILMRTYIDGADKALVCRELGLTHAHFDRVLFRARNRFKVLIDQEGPRLGLQPRITSGVLLSSMLIPWILRGLGG
ncbi:MAG TPA: sigma-70 family RNA polymerase sigma factor [Steroidobacteraceae bacterium]|nr:sigma-70 family RNA polymerase sigma factor [Steroidobacteraceae bacterium]HRX89848.1 sigma-70 family RNA polymerase sigma factor [Steroidobacteraceae bacterium]